MVFSYLFTSFGTVSVAFCLQAEESVRKVSEFSEGHSMLALEIIHVQLCSVLSILIFMITAEILECLLADLSICRQTHEFIIIRCVNK